MNESLENALEKIRKIADAKFDIYTPIEVGDPDYWLTSQELSAVLSHHLVGKSFGKVPIRTRSLNANKLIAAALGYPVPDSFKRVVPRFVGQNFDKYVQKANNLQIWNDELDPERRYVLIKVDDDDTIISIKVVTGVDLAILDTTGTLTQKYQARLVIREDQTELVSKLDTELLRQLNPVQDIVFCDESPAGKPEIGNILSIQSLYEKLGEIIGASFNHMGHDQERNRGGELHRLVCQALGYNNFHDNGQFPDIPHQLLEIKLQTAATIDLGLVTPDSVSLLDMEKIHDINIRHCDVRYALFYGVVNDDTVTITHVYLTTGQDFFSRFPQFGGKVLNRKLQIPLPRTFFDG